MRATSFLLASGLLACLLVVPGPNRVVEPAAAAPVPTDRVIMQGQSFEPPAIIVLIDSTVVWTNKDPAPEVHSVTSDDAQDFEFDNDPVLTIEFEPAALNRASENFNHAGVVEYHCKYHDGMVGIVYVVETLGPVPQTIEVRDNLFDPDEVEIDLNQEVTWQNVGNNNHNLMFEDADIGSLGPLAPAATLNFTFTESGAYRYRCTIHSQADFETGMAGKITVGDAEAQFPPSIRILHPRPADAVQGTVDVNGNATQGVGGVNVTNIQVRIGAGGTWTDAATNGTGSTITWSYAWDASALSGSVTLYAHALSQEFPDPAPVSVTVNVEPNGDGTGGNTTTSGSTGTNEDTPGAAPILILGAMAAVAWAWRRRA